MSDRKLFIKNVDMSEDMKDDAIKFARKAIDDSKDKNIVEKDIASFIKKEFDKKYNPCWHCVVGRKFGCYVTHEAQHFVYFYLDEDSILLFKAG